MVKIAHLQRCSGRLRGMHYVYSGAAPPVPSLVQSCQEAQLCRRDPSGRACEQSAGRPRLDGICSLVFHFGSAGLIQTGLADACVRACMAAAAG